jgi:hypothetical protein
MENTSGLRRIVGVFLVVGAVGFGLNGALHPSASAGSFREATIDILQQPIWPIPHWIGLVTMLLLATTVWLLADSGVTRRSVTAHVGARLLVVASLFMAVQAAAEIMAPSEVPALVAGDPAPLTGLLEVMQTVGWPAFSAGWILLAVGCGRSLAPRLVIALNVAGAAAMGLAGVLVEGFGMVAAAPLFQLGGLQVIWLLWAGIRLARDRWTELAPSPTRTQSDVATRTHAAHAVSVQRVKDSSNR